MYLTKEVPKQQEPDVLIRMSSDEAQDLAFELVSHRVDSAWLPATPIGTLWRLLREAGYDGQHATGRSYL